MGRNTGLFCGVRVYMDLCGAIGDEPFVYGATCSTAFDGVALDARQDAAPVRRHAALALLSIGCGAQTARLAVAPGLVRSLRL